MLSSNFNSSQDVFDESLWSRRSASMGTLWRWMTISLGKGCHKKDLKTETERERERAKGYFCTPANAEKCFVHPSGSGRFSPGYAGNPANTRKPCGPTCHIHVTSHSPQALLVHLIKAIGLIPNLRPKMPSEFSEVGGRFLQVAPQAVLLPTPISLTGRSFMKLLQTSLNKLSYPP